MVWPQLWISSLKACEARQGPLDQCSKWCGVWIALEGAHVCCGPDSLLIATLQNSKKGIQLTLRAPVRQPEAEELWFGVVRLRSGAVSALCWPRAGRSLYLLLLCANACLLSLAAGRLQQSAFCHFMVAPKLLPTNTLSTASPPNVSCPFLSLNLNLLTPPIPCSTGTQSSQAVALMSKGKTIPNISEGFWLKAALLCSVSGFLHFKFKRESEHCMVKQNQSATSTASTRPVAALLLMFSTGRDRSVVPVALGIYNWKALTKKSWRLSHSSNNYLPLHPGLGKEDVRGFLLSI